MNDLQFRRVVLSLDIVPGDKLLIWMESRTEPAKATVTRVAKDYTWFNADVVSGSPAGGMTWTNGRKLTADLVYNVSLSPS